MSSKCDQWETCKPSDFELDGVEIRLMVESEQTKRIELTQGERRFAITPGASYTDSVRLFRPQQPKMVDRYRLHGVSEDGLKIDQLFEDRYKAEAARDDLRSGDFQIEPVKVPESEI